MTFQDINHSLDEEMLVHPFYCIILDYIKLRLLPMHALLSLFNQLEEYIHLLAFGWNLRFQIIYLRIVTVSLKIKILFWEILFFFINLFFFFFCILLFLIFYQMVYKWTTWASLIGRPMHRTSLTRFWTMDMVSFDYSKVLNVMTLMTLLGKDWLTTRILLERAWILSNFYRSYG